MDVGILALQGDVAEHEAVLRACGVLPRHVRRPGDLSGLGALVLPGGESTTIGQLAVDYGLVGPLAAFVRSGRPVLGTCAGIILLASTVGRDQPLVGGLDIEVERNAFGRQVHSFEADLDIAEIGPPPFRGVFIRSPQIRGVGPSVDVLATLDDGEIVAVRQGACIGTSFHPELADDVRIHRLLLGRT